jgi:hypothetical protein
VCFAGSGILGLFVVSVSFLVQPVLVPVCPSGLCCHWFDLCDLQGLWIVLPYLIEMLVW